jgi:precorrin-8X/cobalt-precorrin-8 methylmutase
VSIVLKNERRLSIMNLMQRYALPPDEIYRRSFATIDTLLPLHSQNWSPEEYQVVRRIVHASGDPQLASLVRFKPGALAQAVAALAQQATIFTDVRMVAAGIRMQWCAELSCPVQVLLARYEEVAAALQPVEPITRSAAAVLHALPVLGGSVVVIGNAPTALLALLDALDEGRCQPPALIIGMPVGFVATCESKAALWERPYASIIIEGTRGGSAVAAATVNALLALALLSASSNRSASCRGQVTASLEGKGSGIVMPENDGGRDTSKEE